MPARPSPRLALVLAVASILAACGDAPIVPDPTPVTGTGDRVAEDRTDGAVERVSIGAPVTVVLRAGPETSVTLEGQANVLPLVRTETRDGQLIVNVPAPGYVTTETVTLTVVAPTITSLAMSGGAGGTLELTTDDLTLDLSGGARLLGVGRADALRLAVSSDAVVDLATMPAGSAHVSLVGGAAATLAVDGALTGIADGGSTIILATQPASVNVTTINGGSIIGG